MSNPDTGPGRRISRIPRSRWWRVWRRAARVGLVTVLACAFAGAAQAQDKLDEAVDELAEWLVLGADLEGKAVLVRPGDFFEMGTERSLPLSKYLAWRFGTALGRHGARPVSGTEDDSQAITLQGRWQIESGGGSLLLSVEVKQLAGDGLNERGILASRQKRGPLADIDEEYLRPDLESHGRDVVRQLWKGVAMNAPVDGRRYRLHLQPFEVGSETLPERVGEELLDGWLPAFTGSRFAVFLGDGSAVQYDGELRVTVRDRGGDIVVSLKIHGRGNRLVASVNVEMPKGLFPSGIFGFGSEFQDCPGCPKMVPVPVSYMMGSPESEAGRGDDEGPVHRVAFARPFAVSKYEVTRGEFARFVSERGRSMGESCRTYEGGEWDWRPGKNWKNPGFSQTDEHPVVCVSWKDARAYVGWLSEKAGKKYRLPSESEWEYMARAGTGTARYWGEGESGQCEYANGGDEALKGQYADWKWAVASCNDGHVWTSPVGTFEENGFGLHDVLGNVWEWVGDCWNGSYRGAPADGSAWESGDCERRVLRGGSWGDKPGVLRSAVRFRFPTGYRFSNAGFRVARTLTP